MPSMGVFAMPTSSDIDLDFVADTSTQQLECLIAELDEQIDSMRSSNDVDSLKMFKTFQDLRFKMEQIEIKMKIENEANHWDQIDLSTHMDAYKMDVSIVCFFVGFCVFLVSMSYDLMNRLIIEDNRSMFLKIAFVVLPVLPIIVLYWSVTMFHRIRFPNFY